MYVIETFQQRTVVPPREANAGMVTGLILLAAVTLDALSKRRLERSGR